MSAPQQPNQNPLEVILPAGGKLHLQALDEVDLYEQQRERYVKDYGLTQPNDLFILGALLQQQILAYRAQQGISGMEPQFDQGGLPTGHWVKAQKQDKDAPKKLTEATNQIRVLEQSLGVDKKSRESGGQYTVADYLKTLKAAAHEYGVHISERVLKLEEVFNQAGWRVRLLQNGDAEDRSYHDLTPDKFIQWLAEQIKEVEDADKKFAHEKGKLWVGKV